MAIVDPTVSRRKFADEIAKYRALESQHLQRGCVLLDAQYPKAHVMFCAGKLNPLLVMFCAEVDFQDFDMRAPSIAMVHPFTRLPANWPILIRGKEVPGAEGAPATWVPEPVVMQNRPDEPPFMCLEGIREYHTNPAHSGNSWLLHRKSGQGTLNFLVEQLYNFGIQPLLGLQLQPVYGPQPS